MNYKEILIGLGFKVLDKGNELRMRPIYRDSDNDTSLKVDSGSGRWVDFGANKSGNFVELVRITLKLKDVDEAKAVLFSKFSFAPAETQFYRERLEFQKFFPIEILGNLRNEHNYWLNRNVSEETIKLFCGGVCESGRMKGRYCFPIFDQSKRIVGFTGRTLTESKIKWKNLGQVKYWCWPLFRNEDIIKHERSVILVESPGCVLALWDAGFKNSLCLFGIKCSTLILNTLIRLDLDKILVSLNNEPQNNSIGNKASLVIVNQLSRYFDPDQVIEALPFKKDFGEMNKEEILDWGKKFYRHQ